MTTRAKFRCFSVAESIGWVGQEFVYDATFRPVVGGTPENDQFYAATPSGEIKLSTVRGDHFEVGKMYYVDFTEAD